MTIYVRHIVEYSKNKKDVDTRYQQNEWDFKDQNEMIRYLSSITEMGAFRHVLYGFVSDWLPAVESGVFMREKFEVDEVIQNMPEYFVFKTVNGVNWELCSSNPMSYLDATKLRNQVMDSSPNGARVRIIENKNVN